MTDNADDRHESLGSFASPPCLMHEFADGLGLASETDPQTLIDVTRWRKATRARLIAARMKIDPAERAQMSSRIAIALDEFLGEIAGRTIAGYWPIRSELDLRPWLKRLRGRGGVCALPAVVRRGAPVEFRAWHSDDPLERDLLNIPVPPPTELVAPDIVIAPLVGFDRDCYRLGNGSGYYDRTLAAVSGRPRIIGVGAAAASLPTIYPQPHDVPMDAIITEHGTIIRQPAGGKC
ncbi:MAG: 5-formyltetrahydrofolate cyclo-ligase [Stellaceae bacterium]